MLTRKIGFMEIKSDIDAYNMVYELCPSPSGSSTAHSPVVSREEVQPIDIVYIVQ